MRCHPLLRIQAVLSPSHLLKTVPKVLSEIQMNNFSPIHISVFSQSKPSEQDQQGRRQIAKETATTKNFARVTIAGLLMSQVQDV